MLSVNIQKVYSGLIFAPPSKDYIVFTRLSSRDIARRIMLLIFFGDVQMIFLYVQALRKRRYLEASTIPPRQRDALQSLHLCTNRRLFTKYVLLSSLHKYWGSAHQAFLFRSSRYVNARICVYLLSRSRLLSYLKASVRDIMCIVNRFTCRWTYSSA